MNRFEDFARHSAASFWTIETDVLICVANPGGPMQRYNLIVFQTPQAQHISDFITIRNMMVGPAQDIDMYVISGDAALPPDFWKRAAELPTLIFSPLPLAIEPSARGTRLVSKHRTKLKEIELFVKAGLPVPRTEKLQPATVLDERQWGPFTVLKPNEGGRGRGIRLVRTKHVRWIDPSSWPADDPRHGKDLLAQQYVYPGPYARSYRIFTVLGKVVYSLTSTATEALPAPDPHGDDPLALDVTANNVPRLLELSYDPEVLAMAERIHAAFPDMPTMGIDIIRRHDTGELFILEMNSSGWTWHISSNYGLKHQRTWGLDFYGQFDALGTIIKALIETTRKMAS